jgi:hypothetical protein
MVFGTLTCVFSFLPLLMLYGDKGEFMKSMPTVVSPGPAFGVIVSNTFLPLISYYVLRGQKGFDEGGEVRSFFLFRLWTGRSWRCCPSTAAALQGALKRPWLVSGVAYSVLALVCVLLLPRLGSPVLPAGGAQSTAGGYRVAFERFTDQPEGGGGSSGGSNQESRGSRQRGGVLRRHRPAILLQRRTQGAGKLPRADHHQHARRARGGRL